MSVRVLYVIGKMAPTSVPLEVAYHIDDRRVNIRVAGYYSSSKNFESQKFDISSIGARSWFDYKAVKRLYNNTLDFNPDIVHVHHTVSAFWAAIFGKVLGAKIIRSEHNNTRFRTLRQRVPNTIGRGLADLVLCNSKNTYQSMSSLQKWLVGERWSVVYNGIDAERIDRGASKMPPFGREEGALTIGSVGRLIDQKNYGRLIEAFSKVRSEIGQKVRLVIIGDGENREYLEKKVDRLGLTGCVVFAGQVDRDEVYAALHEFDLFFMSSLWEGFCNAVVEAMAAGLPIVCSDIPTLHEVVGNVAVYMNPEDPSDMARALSGLIREGPKEWQRRGKVARTRARTNFTVERTAERYVESYLDVAERSIPHT